MLEPRFRTHAVKEAHFISVFLMQYDSTWVEATIKTLTLEEKIGQVLMPAIFDCEDESVSQMEAQLKRFATGGLFVMNATVEGLAAGIPKLARATRIPLLMASDFESGIGHIMKCGTRFSRPMLRGRKGSAKDEYEIGRITAEEGRAVGFHVTFSPVLDLNTNPLNPDINVRAYGDDLRTVTRLGIQNIKGLQEHGMLACAKHFPGNGDTAMDPHLSPAILNTPAARYRKNWIETYRRCFKQADVAAIMAGFIVIPSLMTEREPRSGALLPASLSREVLVDLLRGEMKYQGLVISDALNMGGANNLYPRSEIAGRALAAGCDMLLCFVSGGDISQEAESIRTGLREGWLGLERLEEAVRRVLVAKAKAGLDKRPSTCLETVEAIKAVFCDNKVITDRSVRKGLTVLANKANTLPLGSLTGKKALMLHAFSPSQEVFFSRADSPSPGYLAEELRKRGAIVEELTLSENSRDGHHHEALKKAAEADLCFINLYCVPSWAIGTLLPPKEAVRIFYGGINTLCKIPPIVTAFGDPYSRQLCHSFPTFLCTFDDTKSSFEAAVKVWTGEQAARGRMPVSMPGIFERGDGIDVG